MRKYGKVDLNQKPLVAYAESLGASWLSMDSLGDGKPDGLLGYQGQTFLVEIKQPKGTLTADQQAFIASWQGSPVHVVRTAQDIDELLRKAAK